MTHWHFAQAVPDPDRPAKLDVTVSKETGDYQFAKRSLVPMIELLQGQIRYKTPVGEVLTPANWWMRQDSEDWFPLAGCIFAVRECSGHCGGTTMDFRNEVVEIFKEVVEISKTGNRLNVYTEEVHPW